MRAWFSDGLAAPQDQVETVVLPDFSCQSVTAFLELLHKGVSKSKTSLHCSNEVLELCKIFDIEGVEMVPVLQRIKRQRQDNLPASLALRIRKGDEDSIEAVAYDDKKDEETEEGIEGIIVERRDPSTISANGKMSGERGKRTLPERASNQQKSSNCQPQPKDGKTFQRVSYYPPGLVSYFIPTYTRHLHQNKIETSSAVEHHSENEPSVVEPNHQSENEPSVVRPNHQSDVEPSEPSPKKFRHQSAGQDESMLPLEKGSEERRKLVAARMSAIQQVVSKYAHKNTKVQILTEDQPPEKPIEVKKSSLSIKLVKKSSLSIELVSVSGPKALPSPAECPIELKTISKENVAPSEDDSRQLPKGQFPASDPDKLNSDTEPEPVEELNESVMEICDPTAKDSLDSITAATNRAGIDYDLLMEDLIKTEVEIEDILNDNGQIVTETITPQDENCQIVNETITQQETEDSVNPSKQSSCSDNQQESSTSSPSNSVQGPDQTPGSFQACAERSNEPRESASVMDPELRKEQDLAVTIRLKSECSEVSSQPDFCEKKENKSHEGIVKDIKLTQLPVVIIEKMGSRKDQIELCKQGSIVINPVLKDLDLADKRKKNLTANALAFQNVVQRYSQKSGNAINILNAPVQVTKQSLPITKLSTDKGQPKSQSSKYSKESTHKSSTQLLSKSTVECVNESSSVVLSDMQKQDTNNLLSNASFKSNEKEGQSGLTGAATEEKSFEKSSRVIKDSNSEEKRKMAISANALAFQNIVQQYSQKSGNAIKILNAPVQVTKQSSTITKLSTSKGQTESQSSKVSKGSPRKPNEKQLPKSAKECENISSKASNVISSDEQKQDTNNPKEDTTSMGKEKDGQLDLDDAVGDSSSEESSKDSDVESESDDKEMLKDWMDMKPAAGKTVYVSICGPGEFGQLIQDKFKGDCLTCGADVRTVKKALGHMKELLGDWFKLTKPGKYYVTMPGKNTSKTFWSCPICVKNTHNGSLKISLLFHILRHIDDIHKDVKADCRVCGAPFTSK